MRILCVITNLDTGGAQRQLVNLARGLKRRGHFVEFFTYYPQDFFQPELDQADIPVHLCIKTRRFSFAPVWQLRRRIMHGAFDVVLAFLETAVVYAELACLGLPAVSVVASERNSAMNNNISAGRLAKSLLHLLASTVVINSHAHRKWMAVRFPWLKRRLVTIWNGVDTEAFYPFRNASSTSTLKLLGVGRITPQKNLPALVLALAECKRKNLQVTLDWAGETDDETCNGVVLSAIENHRLGDIWHWLGLRKDIPALLHQYDALILPSLWEGLPNVVAEALAAGLPVLASGVSDNARLVQDGVTGFIFDPKLPGDIARAICQFALLDREARACFALAARTFAEKELSLTACVDVYERLLMASRKTFYRLEY